MVKIKEKNIDLRKQSKSGRAGLNKKETKKALAAKIMKILCQQYPDASCELTFKTPFQLLIATILSAQTTDVSVNKVTKILFKEFPDPVSLAGADPDRLREIIKPTGYYNAKANNIQACAQQLIANFGGQVPKTQNELVTLSGVGRKTANVVLGVAYGVPGWAVDTHVQRLSKRLGFTKETDPLKIEKDLDKLFPDQDWSKLSITLIFHGRRICTAKKPTVIFVPLISSVPARIKFN